MDRELESMGEIENDWLPYRPLGHWILRLVCVCAWVCVWVTRTKTHFLQVICIFLLRTVERFERNGQHEKQAAISYKGCKQYIQLELRFYVLSAVVSWLTATSLKLWKSWKLCFLKLEWESRNFWRKIKTWKLLIWSRRNSLSSWKAKTVSSTRLLTLELPVCLRFLMLELGNQLFGNRSKAVS